MEEVMTRWLMVLAVTVASSTASAESRPAGQPAAITSTITSTAESMARSAEHQVVQLSVYRATLAKRYKDELDQIDRLKNQRASWRRDRELRDNLSDSLETANQLSAATRDLEKAKIGLANARRSYLTAIDAELTAGTTPVRAQQLARARAQLAPQVNDAPRRIVIPDFEVDPLADPEELEQRANELRASEEELGRQVAGLAAQAEELEHLVLLRKQHDRAGDLFNRDDEEPHRNTGRPEGGPTDDGGSGRVPNTPITALPGLDNFVPIMLIDVIDASTMNSLTAAQRSGDPAQRATAARQARDAVARRIAEIRNRRLEIEARARQLRGKH
jgi:hypothetical protein